MCALCLLIMTDRNSNRWFQYDTATYSFGNVTNLNTSTGASASKIAITFSVTLRDDLGLCIDDSFRYWISAGVEYNGGEKLWIGQIGFLLDKVPQVETESLRMSRACMTEERIN